MKTMGLSALYLVNPRRFPDPEAQWRAAHAADVLAEAQERLDRPLLVESNGRQAARRGILAKGERATTSTARRYFFFSAFDLCAMSARCARS